MWDQFKYIKCVCVVVRWNVCSAIVFPVGNRDLWGSEGLPEISACLQLDWTSIILYNISNMRSWDQLSTQIQLRRPIFNGPRSSKDGVRVMMSQAEVCEIPVLSPASLCWIEGNAGHDFSFPWMSFLRSARTLSWSERLSARNMGTLFLLLFTLERFSALSEY